MLKSRAALRTRRFLRNRSGATAVEFALVVGPFLFMLFAVMELGLVFFLSSTLENATSQVARTIRTGGAQTAGQTKDGFRNAICAKLGWLASQCQTNLSVDVRTFTDFSTQNPPNPITTSGSTKTWNEGATTYSPGAKGSIVLVRAFYRWKLISPFLTGGLERISGGTTVLTATTTFMNEPY